MKLFTEDYAESFDKYRAQPANVIEEYKRAFLNETLKYRGKVKALDIGCGAGQFAIPFSSILSQSGGDMVAIDSSEHMTNILRKKVSSLGVSNLKVLETTLLDYKSSSIHFDIIWMSDFIHLYSSFSDLVSDISQLANSNSTIMIRFSSHEQLRSYEWGDHFPSALKYDLSRHHSNSDICDTLTKYGFCGIELVEIDETRMVDSEEYLKYFRSKYLSSIRTISQVEFIQGIQRMEDLHKKNDKVTRNARTSLVIARRANNDQLGKTK